MAKLTTEKKKLIAEAVEMHAKAFADELVDHMMDKLGDWDFYGVLGDDLTDKQYDEACQQVLLSVAEKWIASHKRRG